MVVTSTETKYGVPLCLGQMWVHLKKNNNSDLQKWFWTQTQQLNQPPLRHQQHVLFIDWELREEEDKTDFLAFTSDWFQTIKQTLIWCLATEQFLPKHPWFRGISTDSSCGGLWNPGRLKLGRSCGELLCLQVLPGWWPVQEGDGRNLEKLFLAMMHS